MGCTLPFRQKDLIPTLAGLCTVSSMSRDRARIREASCVLGRGRYEFSQLLQCPPQPGAMFMHQGVLQSTSGGSPLDSSRRRSCSTLPASITLFICLAGTSKACCRPDYLRQTLDSLSQLAGLERMAVYISQDGDNSAVAAVVQGFAADALAPPRTRAFQHWQRKRNPQLGAHQASVLLAGVLSCIWLAMPECVC